MLRIVFFGTPEFAVRSLEALLDSAHEVVGVVTQPDRPRGRGQKVSPSPVKACAEAAGAPVWQPDRLRDEAFLDALRTAAPDLGVVAAYGKLLPESLLQIPRLGMINVHASLLPRHRGAAPIQRAIIDGDRTTGVTIMRMVKALDAGAMLSTQATPIDPDETAATLEARLAVIGAGLLVAALDPLERGHIVETPQNEAEVTYASRIVKPDGLVAWDVPARAIHDKVRGLIPWPHAFAYVDGTRIVFHETRPFTSLDAAWQAAGHRDASAALPQPPTPGVVLPAPKGHLLIAAGEGTVLDVLQLQEEGRRVLSAREFLAGRPLPTGTSFSSADPT
jgi:methionyl-tRNA formyltransferase